MHSPAPNPLPYEPARSSGKWVVGTLTYTTAGLAVLFFWLLFGDFALAMRERTVGDVVQVTLKLKEYKVSDTFMSIFMVSLPPAISVVLVPVVAYKSDRYRSRWGRRIPFLLVPVPLAVVSMIGIGFTPQIAKWLAATLGPASPGVPLCFMGTFALFWTVFEVATLTINPLFGGLINDTVPRPLLGRFYGMFRFVSLGCGMIEGFFILKYAESHLTQIFLIIAAVYGIGFTIMCLRVREGEYPPPDTGPGALPQRSALGILSTLLHIFRDIFHECFRQPYYLWVFAAMLVGGLTFVPFNSFSIPYARSLNIPLEAYGHWKSWSYFASLCLAIPLGFLVDKVHALRVGILAQVLYLASVLYGSFFVRDADTFRTAFIAHTILSGTYFTASASLGQALFPKAKFGQYSAAAGQVTALGQIALGLILGPILDASHHNYKLTFVIGLALCCTAILSLTIVYRRFMALGGPQFYVAPTATPAQPPPAFEVLPPK